MVSCICIGDNTVEADWYSLKPYQSTEMLQLTAQIDINKE